MNQLILFDYETLSDEDSSFIRGQTGLIKSLVKRTAEGIIQIGESLIAVKAKLKHGQFGDWLAAEFDWSEITAQRMMNVAQRFENHQIDGFGASALYLLASPSTPEAARAEAIHRAHEHGESISHSEAKAIIEKHTKDGKNETVSFLPEPVTEKSNDPPEVFELEHSHEKLDGKPKSTCPKCGFRYI